MAGPGDRPALRCGDRGGPARRARLTLVCGLSLCGALAIGCATAPHRQGALAAGRGDWDAAAEHYRLALQEEPSRVDYRAAFERATRNASWAHIDAARVLEQRNDLPGARAEYALAAAYDPSNARATEGMAAIDRTLRDPVPGGTAAAPVQARPPAPRLQVRFTDASLRDILNFLGEAGGFNVLYDPQFQDRPFSVQLDDVTVEEALDLVLTASGHFYKVLSPREVAVGAR
jgi:general secretion pathway protein D